MAIDPLDLSALSGDDLEHLARDLETEIAIIAFKSKLRLTNANGPGVFREVHF